MPLDSRVNGILSEAMNGRPITKAEAELFLSFPENSLEAVLLQAAANSVSRRRFGNNALLLGQIGVYMAPCDGDCSFCFFAKSHTTTQALVLSTEEIIARCERFAFAWI